MEINPKSIYTEFFASSMKRLIINSSTLIIVVFLSSGCSTRSENKSVSALDWEIQTGVNTITLEYGGISRKFIVHLPKRYQPEKSYPVIFAFHGAGRTNWDWPDHLGSLIDSKGFISVYPQGIRYSWNIYAGGGRSGVSDVEFTEAILDWLGTKVIVNKKQVYALGWSLGGIFCHTLGRYSDKFAAIATISASFYENPTFDIGMPKLSVLQIHGELDNVIPYNGGVTKSGYFYESAQNTAALWAKHNGCNENSEISHINGNITIFHYKNCEIALEVLLYSLANNGHHIPETYKGVFKLIWDFFERNPRK
jgi:polyhydroxybutyrate depolymerase